MSENTRGSPRYRVALQVRYETARDFVVEYAENLSEGGLFVRGAHTLSPGDRVTVTLELPGFRGFEVGAEVAHVLPPADAARRGRKPGAGFRIVEEPPGFGEAMRSYLLRLGRRRDSMLLVASPTFAAMLEEAGYNVRQAPLPDELLEAVGGEDMDILAVVVPRDAEAGYTAAASRMGAPELVRAVDFEEELDTLLAELDEDLLLTSGEPT